VLLDGLVALAVPEVLAPEGDRLRLVVLVHQPLVEMSPGGDAAEARTREGEVLSAACAVVATSEWTRQRLLDRHPLPPDRVHVAEPGVAPADLATGTSYGGELLCVGPVAPHKGHDVLLAALGTLRHRSWRCTCVGSLDRDPDFVDALRGRARANGIEDRVRLNGPLTGEDLDAAYATADVLVLPSRGETYGMVVTEALARGLPVIATAVGGLPRTLHGDASAAAAGLLVAPEDPAALADALCAWLDDADLRQRLRGFAARRRTTLADWSATADRVAHVLVEVRC
jgi:glycosyltransferase involved in cell wall biosynthesis